jgi:phosphatidylinositol alpha-1,6-mannosyltransferase
MKILLATYEYPPDFGGVATYLGGLFGALPKESVKILKFKMPAARFGWLLHLPRLWRSSRQVDIVVVSHVLPLGTSAMMIGKPYAVIVHGLDLRSAAVQPRKKKIASRVLKNAKLLIANSRATASELSAFGLDPASALILTPCPGLADFSDRTGLLARPEVSGRINLDAWDVRGKRVLLSVGRFVPRKGFDRLIRLLPELRKACGDVVLIIAGAGAEEGRLRSDAALSGVERHVRFVIAPDRETLASLYKAADVFALAVRAMKDDIEGFGLVFLEAALFGVPSVSSRIGGVPEAIEDGRTGLLADPESDGDLYEKLRRLLNDRDEASRLGQAARARVLSDFLWKDRAALLIERLS